MILSQEVGQGPAEPRIQFDGDRFSVKMLLPTHRPDTALICRVEASLEDLRLPHHRLLNSRRSDMVLNGMLFLVALCGWVVGGEEGAHRALSGGIPTSPTVINPEAMLRQFGARRLTREMWPALFDVLTDISRRARLPRLPELYYLPEPHSMNAYALGGPEHSAITLTEGLLRGMTMGEITGILAHEVAHISNNDGWAMTLAAALHRATSLTALLGQAQRHDGPLATLLSSAPMIGQLLHMALSRLREFDADAVALELVDDPHAFLAALHKLEHHHNGPQGWAAPPPSNDMLRFLRSHPETWERVGTLLSLAWR